MPDLTPASSSSLGPAFTERSDLIPMFLLRYDRENTRRAYRRDIRRFFGSDVVTLEMAQQVRFTDVNHTLRVLELDGKSPATRRRFIASLRGFFAWLTALGFLDMNPADRHLVRKVPRASGDQVMTVLTREQASRMLSAIDLDRRTGLRDFALVSTLLHCVLRRSEAASMNVEDLSHVDGHAIMTIVQAKGGADQIVKIPGHVRGTIDRLIEAEHYSSGPLWRSFSNRHLGKRLSGTSIYNIVRSAALEAGVPEKVGAHTLRHTGCTLAIENGASIQQVQTHARHKSIETTMRYIHQRNKLANSAADFIDL